ncbi:hypothetical protein M8J76_010205 [Diaphorina citri]|nr:hypothetical protein M8J75_012001 [Diaphorina citri]KAI5722555.1 hypothetical protein M8J76_010205 [Diaphorina citri]KAI5724317.1 hypothetical protein M8J77_001261 [Diaphorina citri]
MQASQDHEATSLIGSYKNLQTFGKAVKKIKGTLPNSPRKKEAVIKKVVTDILGPNVLVQKLQKKPSHILSEEHKAKVKEFYCQDDISCQAPGIKDTISLRSDKDKPKNKVQKRYMIITIGEAFELFKLSYPDIKIGKTAFFNLRPPQVLPSAHTPHNVCICKYHYNFISIVESLSKTIECFPKTHRTLLNLVCCSTTNEDCMFGLFGTCEKCKDLAAAFPDIEEQYNTAHTSWKQWVEEKGRPILKEVKGTVQEALFDLKKKIPQFKKHSFIKGPIVS